MKKSIAALSAAAVLGLGLGVAGPASADSYTGTVPTKSDVKTPTSVPAGQKVKLKFSVDAAGNVDPSGTVIFVLKGANGKFFKITKDYDGGNINGKFPGLPKGTYSVKVKFIPDPGSVFQADIDKGTLRVK